MAKPDLYTKVILSIIAFCLVVLVADKINLIPAAVARPSAASPAAPASYGLVPLNKDGSITVRLPQNEVVDVQLRGIDESSYLRWEAIPVRPQ